MDEYKYYERLKESLEQAVAFKSGDESKAKVSVCDILFPLKNDDAFSQQEWLKAALLRKGTPIETLEADEQGNIIIDKEKHPDLYDWAVNG